VFRKPIGPADRDRSRTRTGAGHGDPTSRGWTTPRRRPRQRGPDQLPMDVRRPFGIIKQAGQGGPAVMNATWDEGTGAGTSAECDAGDATGLLMHSPAPRCAAHTMTRVCCACRIEADRAVQGPVAGSRAARRVQPRVAAWDRAAAGVRGADLKRDRRARASRQSTQFSPLMSWTTADPSQMSRVGTIKPTPLPERVGAKHSHTRGRGGR
jgi:hypothetical protein